MSHDLPSQPLSFWRRGAPVTLPAVPADRTLLQVLRDDLHCTGTKEGCGEGDCGACTVVLGEAVDGQLELKAVNACIKMAHSVHGQAVFTVEDLVAPDGALHPVQEAMHQCHGSQCGFCTPGFVMSLYALYENSGAGQGVTREAAQAALSGNLCRCTGYRPILDAAERMGQLPCPSATRLDPAAVLRGLRTLGPAADTVYQRPTSLQALLQARAAHPKAQVIAGTTDVGLWVTKLFRQYPQILDVTGAAELRHVEDYPHHIAIGAAVSLTDAYAALVAERPQLASFAHRFAGLPVRNAGTLGGNVANGSPIGDSMPLLIALGASVVLMRWDSKRRAIAHRELRLEDLYTGYRQNVMRPDELLCWIKVPRPTADEFMRADKISKRFEDDISAVCLAVNLRLRDGVVADASIGVGGVAATPVRARQTEAALRGQPWNADTVMTAAAVLRAEFNPISDMRASADYRRAVLGNLLRRLWLDHQGVKGLRLEAADHLEVPA
ncbi:xanthine dehydrogenase small subunit [Hydrogenophaga sp.]|uniref:xanthine dehydrogenase small subunit n=1 Tax=Hydrogenophaga sp. TaxID=1904254 RepID=UPI0025BBEFB9|nr:xanthine dehydrogenase small subunit [Hydrogenophaga sp.]